MCVLMLGVLLYLARALLLPVLCAISVGLTIGPLEGHLKRRGIPDWLTALVVVLGLIGITNAALVMLAGPASALLARAPEYGAAFAEKLHVFERPLQSLHELQTALGIDTSDKTFDFNPAALITGFLTIATPGRAAIRAAGPDVLRHAVLRHHGPQRLSQIRGELVRRPRDVACAR